MVSITKRQLKNIFWLMFAFILSECANQLPPEGGAVDTIPPKIVEVYPADGTINFSDDYFELGFSEYVEKRTVKDAIFISPAIEGELELDWSGKYVQVYFPGNLKLNVTYVVTIGTDVEDYNNKNKMAEAFTFTFSTGPEIDRRAITGKIFDEKPQGIMIFGYLLKDAEPNPLETKPDYISQSGADGTFKLAGLAAGSYRIFAVRDEFRDLLFQPDQDDIGIPYLDAVLQVEDTLFSGLNFVLTKIDTLSPRLLSASMTDRSHILVNFSEELDRRSIKAINSYLFDSTASKRTQIKYAFKGGTKPSELVLVPNEILPKENLIYLFADSIRDNSNNIFNNDFVQLTISDRPDTSKTQLSNSMPPSESKDVDFLAPKFTFEFNDAFDLVKAREGITFSDTLKKNFSFEVEFLDDASFVISPLKRLEASKNYVIKIDLEYLKDASGNFYDSVYQYTFKTITGLEFTGVSGKVLNVDGSKNPKLVLRNAENVKAGYSTAIQKNDYFNFERIIPGKYLLSAFYDLDSNNVYSKGEMFPFKASEEFSFYPDTLKLRARWTETDLKFNFNAR
jgi:hypothetical protein